MCIKFAVTVGWTLCVLSAFFSIHGLAPFFDRDTFYVAMPDFGPTMRIGFGAFHRSVFSLAIAWVIFACTRQYGGKMRI